MKQYELLYMVPPTFAETEIDGVAGVVNQCIGGSRGTIKKEHRWGVRKIAYPISNFHQAHFILLDIELDPKEIASLDQKLRREGKILRHLITSLRPQSPKEEEIERNLTEKLKAEHEEHLREKREQYKESSRGRENFRTPLKEFSPAQISGGKPSPKAEPPLVHDEVVALEKESTEQKSEESKKGPGFLQEEAEKKDGMDFDELNKKIDKILKDDIL